MKGKVWLLIVLSAIFLLYFSCNSEKEAPSTKIPRTDPAETGSLKEGEKPGEKKEPPVEKRVAAEPEMEEEERTEPPKEEPAEVAKSEPKPGKTREPETEREKLSYVLGLDVGTSLRDLETEIDLKQFGRGLEDMLFNKYPLVGPEEASLIKEDFADRKAAEQIRKDRELGERNAREGKAFLEKNKAEPDVVATESGLQYLIVSEGTGPKPGPSDRVKVHYSGTLLDGTEFDNSYERGAPSVFSLTSVIPGWTEALRLMSEGSKYRLFLPPHLAYGTDGAGRQIGPNATLIFEVELISIER